MAGSPLAEVLCNELITSLIIQDRVKLSELFRTNANANLSAALLFMEAKQPIYDLAALDCMATGSLMASEAPLSEAYALACLCGGYQFWKMCLPLPLDDLDYYLGNSCYTLFKILLDTGQYHRTIELYESVQKMKVPGWEKDVFTSAHLKAAENYLESRRFDRAKAIVEGISPEKVLPVSRVLYDRLRYNLNLYTSATHHMPEEVEQYKRVQQLEDLKRMLASVKVVMEGYEDEMDIAALEQLLNLHLEAGDISAQELVILTQRISAQALTAQARISGVDPVDSLEQKRYKLHDLVSFLHDEKLAYDPVNLKEALPLLQEFFDWFGQRGINSDAAFVGWCQYICFNRLEQYSEAAEVLEQVYWHLEAQRASISNIQQRAGVFKQYPALFGAMAFTNYQSGNISRLFHRIEASKGRNLADRLSSDIGREENVPNPDQLYEKLVPLLPKNDAHYLSLFVDEDRTFSVLLTKQGKLYATAKGPGETELKDWLKKDYASPQSWNVPRAGLFGKKQKVDIPLELGKLLDPLKYAMEDGLVAVGEHLAYSPDGILNLFPLQIAQWQGIPVIEKFSMSKIHSGFQLANLLERPSSAPSQRVAISCSAMQDDELKVAAFEEIVRWLVPEDLEGNEDASVSEVVACLQPDKLYHFATHGVFPKEHPEADLRQLNPYYNSGFLLMSEGKKPFLQPFFSYEDSVHLLSPKKIIESGVDLKGSHISMQACVSGRALEGYGGDALGMEWALFYAGAQSMVSANWDIDVDWSNRFFKAFYESWLEAGRTAAEAHQLAVLDVMRDSPRQPFPHEYYWGGLSLIGDFR